LVLHLLYLTRKPKVGLCPGDHRNPISEKRWGFLFGVGAKEKEFPNGSKILKGVDHGRRRKQSD
jgi:hypothetical protein